MDPIKAFIALIILALSSFSGGLIAGGYAIASDILIEQAIKNIGAVSAGLAFLVAVAIVVYSIKESTDELMSIHTVSALVTWVAFSIGMIMVGASPI